MTDLKSLLAAPAPVVGAAAATLAAWWLLSLAAPDAPPDVAETGVIFVAFYAIALGVRHLLKRRARGRTDPDSHA